MKFYSFLLLFLFSLISPYTIFSQSSANSNIVDYSNPKEYEIAEFLISGVQVIDKNMIQSMAGINVGDKITIPGDEVTKIVKKFWNHGLFSDVKFNITKIEGDKVFIDLYLKERPRLSKVDYEGVKKSELSDLKEKLKLRSGSQVTDDVISSIRTIITKHYIDKGYYNVKIDIEQKPDSASTYKTNLLIKISKNKRVKISEIYFDGNVQVKASKLRKSMKKTKRRDWNIFNTSKLISADYKEDKSLLIDYYNKNGYRDAKILSDSISIVSEKRVNLYINLYEGKKYYFRNITWVGNTKYPTDALDQTLGIKKGDVFNQEELDKRLQSDEDAVSSLYMDNGYLAFNVNPVELRVENDSIDYEMRIYEGSQFTINEIIIKGNTKTNENVVRRELRTLPGNLFSKSDIIRSVRELASLGYFEPEKIVPNPLPDQTNNTVDIEFNLVERANDQLEISGGWGAGMFIGSVGLRFSNFSTRSMFQKDSWRPLPSGDGQTLSINARTSGPIYTQFGIQFVEPWLGGKRPNSFSTGISYSRYAPGAYQLKDWRDASSYMITKSVNIGLGRRLTWPDDYFMISNSLGFDNYLIKNIPGFFNSAIVGNNAVNANNFNLSTTISRVSTDRPIYPRSGSNFSFLVQLTPPYSLFNGKDYKALNEVQKSKLVEYNKFVFKGDWFFRIVQDLVLMQRAHFGLLGMYNKDVGYSLFEKFVLGGGGMPMSYSYLPNDIVPLRGYKEEALTPRIDEFGNVLNSPNLGNQAGNIYNKFTMELRYPISLKEQAIIFAYIFADAGNSWAKFSDYNPFVLKRSAGIGLRAMLPFLGTIGFDYGIPFDPIPGATTPGEGEFHFIFGQQL